MNKAQYAVDCFKQGFTCSQAVLSAFNQELQLDEEKAFKLACGFGAGMGRTGQTCGAVTGAYLVISLKYGRTKLEDKAVRDKTYVIIQEFARRFKITHKSVNCTELMGYDLGNPAEYEKAAEQGLFIKLCSEYVRTAVEILEKIL